MNISGFYPLLGLDEGTNYGVYLFTSYIMICLPLLFRWLIKQKLGNVKSGIIVLLLMAVFNTSCIVFGLNSDFFSRLNHVFFYLLVYVYSDRIIKPFGKSNWKYTVAVTVGAILAVLMVLFRNSNTKTTIGLFNFLFIRKHRVVLLRFGYMDLCFI